MNFDYKNRTTPKLSIAIGGFGLGRFSNPRGIAIHYSSGRMYVADFDQGKVDVFNKKGKILFKFGNTTVPEMMYGPHGVCIKYDMVYVTQWWGNNIKVYNIEGEYKFESKRCGLAKFERARGISIDERGIIYACDYKSNEIKVFDRNLNLITIFGKEMSNPIDIHATRREVVILDSRDPCIHAIGENDGKTYSMVSSEFGVKGSLEKIKFSNFFTMDRLSNLLISDSFDSSIKHYDKYGQFQGEMKGGKEMENRILYPEGVTLDFTGELLCVCPKEKGCVMKF